MLPIHMHTMFNVMHRYLIHLVPSSALSSALIPNAHVMSDRVRLVSRHAGRSWMSLEAIYRYDAKLLAIIADVVVSFDDACIAPFMFKLNVNTCDL
jgi:hypothetical protein